jgi:hypothetical protein
MIYLLYERAGGFEMDKSKFTAKSLMNMSKLMRKRVKNGRRVKTG